MPVLITTVQMTNGPVLELGAGIFSTPLLHWLCEEKKRKLVTFEDVKKYYRFAKQYRSKTHSVEFVEDWDKIKIDKHWSVALIDHPENRRVKDALRLKDRADYIIIHDTQDSVYGYDKIWPHFKYIYHWKYCKPWTSVLSNTYEIDPVLYR
jgi:hypothetical protein